MTVPLRPPPTSPTPTDALRVAINTEHNLALAAYDDLLAWSSSHIASFWSQVWDFAHPVIGTKPNHGFVDASALPGSNPAWFTGATLNWAENILRYRTDTTALIEAVEPLPGLAPASPRTISYGDLYLQVADVVSALLTIPLLPGDRVASYSSNCIENLVALLATTALGGIWVGAAADFGPEGVLERFEQVQPKVIFAVESVVYNGKVHNHIPKLSQLLQGLRDKSLSPAKVIVIQSHENSHKLESSWTSWTDFRALGKQQCLGQTEDGEIRWHRASFDWPLWILFSSGTTGWPIVHRAGGMLLQSKKELVICADIKPGDVFFYYTTTGWMMYNFLVAGLQIGCTLFLYDGSPLKDPSLLWRWVDQYKINQFGTSAKYLDQLSRVYKPREHHSLSSLRAIYSTGSPLSPALFDYVYEHIHPDVLLGSITGGTDICSLFAGMNTSLPVYRGEIQCRMLGMAVDAYSPSGQPVPRGTAGELVCTRPFPCQPLGFWPLPGFGSEKDVKNAQERYQKSYFDMFKGIWNHGDHVIITESREGNGGGVIMLGRSDGVLNPGGVRFGTAELYEVIEMRFSESTAPKPDQVIVDCIAVGQSILDGTDERVILFVKLLDGFVLGDELEQHIRTEIRARRSARHVPSKIIQVQDIPHTLNGKRVEVPIKRIINGAAISEINQSTLKNPECLVAYQLLGEQLRADTK
ncbi:acetoacyl-CoA synthetase [Sistotremastrum suecicum HHB10207 ss-3]|uniref:Acetoacyl-CoA synthetase n=1 Tax=Sistotremastrum suecicum HHB10207 ss-3 TaxID=1314776 RepID=A0A166EI13_9AGAM|nr:acetoacyl-CoA synthetase [Sistotremastrum suecicum HHB10207 ss-3]